MDIIGNYTSHGNISFDDTPINFLLFGDWGKGGNDGDITAVVSNLMGSQDDDRDTSIMVPHSETNKPNLRSNNDDHNLFSSIQRQLNRILSLKIKTKNLSNSRSLRNIQRRLLQSTKTHAITSDTLETIQNNNDNQNQKNNNNNKNKQVYTYQAAIAKSMSSYASELRPAASFIIALGDNFYNDGVSSTSDSLWTSLWSDVRNMPDIMCIYMCKYIYVDSTYIYIILFYIYLSHILVVDRISHEYLNILSMRSICSILP